MFGDSDDVPNDYTISLSVTDEDGEFSDVGTLPVTVSEPVEVITVDAGPDFTDDEGGSTNLAVTFTDPTDQGGDGWSYTINWGDGTPDTTGVTSVRNFNRNHTYADGDAVYTATVTVTDISSTQEAGVDDPTRYAAR